MTRFDCAAVDELDAAYTLGAVAPGEARAVEEHLADCRQPHAELRADLGAELVLAAALPPVTPRPELRDRLMASIDRTPQVHAASGPEQPRGAARRAPTEAPGERHGWLDWLSPGWARGVAVAAVVAVVALGGWNAALRGQLSQQDRAIALVADAVASGATAYRIAGDAGAGWLVADGQQATFIGADLTQPPSGDIMELWLIDESGTPVAAGVLDPAATLAVSRLAIPIDDYAMLAITVEDAYVDAPTSDPVMVGELS